MPMYEYACANEECKACGEVIFVVKSMNDASQPERCFCGEPMERVFTSPPASSVKGGTPRFHRRG